MTGLRPKKRPVKKQQQFKTTERGFQKFQYLMKEGHDPLYSRGFTPAELEELKTQSEAHVHELKNGLQDFLHAKKFPTYSPDMATPSPVQLHKSASPSRTFGRSPTF